MTRIRTKLLVKHRHDCNAVKDVQAGKTARLWFVRDECEYRTAAGSKGGRLRWRVYACNDPYCCARLIVNDNDVIDAAVKYEDKDCHCQTERAPKGASR